MKNTTLPEQFKSCFWDTKFEDLDIKLNKDVIIPRMFVKGGINGIIWVRQTYSAAEIRESVQKSRSLNPIVANYLSKYYDIPEDDMAYYRLKSMGGRKLWDY